MHVEQSTLPLAGMFGQGLGSTVLSCGGVPSAERLCSCAGKLLLSSSRQWWKREWPL